MDSQQKLPKVFINNQSLVYCPKMLKIAYNLLFHFEKFRPTAMIDHFSQMKDIAQKQKLNYLVIDKDDTIVPVYQFEIKDKRIHDTLSHFHHTGRFVIIVSNSVVVDEKNQPPEVRINNHEHFFDILLTKEPKPFCGKEVEDLMEIQKELNPSKLPLDKSKVAIIGDRLLTDIHMANLMGWKSYLVKPLEQTTIAKHGVGVWLMRHFESFIIKRSGFNRYTPSQTKDQPQKDSHK